MANDSTTRSHATGSSKVPSKLQEKLPHQVEDLVPNSIHDTGSGAGSSHATEKSFVPKVCIFGISLSYTYSLSLPLSFVKIMLSSPLDIHAVFLSVSL